ncbi:hypothetical protein LUZ60_016376 [Juncus effusus]|nr:hypothetical protein LUZ60_016376 [Juncus effusus]
MGVEEQKSTQVFSLPLVSLNHVSFLCASVENSVRFYKDVLGFDLIKRPTSLDFKGAWLHKCGISIHLLQTDNSDSITPKKEFVINPKSNHISFQCDNIEMVRNMFMDIGIKFVSAKVKDGDILVDQIFFHDPDGNMIEICDCQKFPVILLSPVCQIKSSTGFVKRWLGIIFDCF